MSNYKESKYPEIIIDKDRNLPNPDGSVTLTFEQYYDLLHHTHNGIPEEASAQITELQNTITEMKTEVEDIKASIEELKTNSLNIGDWDVEQEGDQSIDESNDY